MWQKLDYVDGIHLRRIHYQLVFQDPPVIRPNGKPYENTTNDWAYLLRASKAARYLNQVNPAAFVDRRNPDPHDNAGQAATLVRQYLETQGFVVGKGILNPVGVMDNIVKASTNLWHFEDKKLVPNG